MGGCTTQQNTPLLLHYGYIVSKEYLVIRHIFFPWNTILQQAAYQPRRHNAHSAIGERKRSLLKHVNKQRGPKHLHPKSTTKLSTCDQGKVRREVIAEPMIKLERTKHRHVSGKTAFFKQQTKRQLFYFHNNNNNKDKRRRNNYLCACPSDQTNGGADPPPPPHTHTTRYTIQSINQSINKRGPMLCILHALQACSH